MKNITMLKKMRKKRLEFNNKKNIYLVEYLN